VGKIETQGHIEPFLLRNGFNKTDEFSYSNDYCNVVIKDSHYAVADNLGGVMYSTDHSFYWLLGYLVWDGFIEKNFKN
jgi:hypothetical protein